MAGTFLVLPEHTCRSCLEARFSAMYSQRVQPAKNNRNRSGRKLSAQSWGCKPSVRMLIFLQHDETFISSVCVEEFKNGLSVTVVSFSSMY